MSTKHERKIKIGRYSLEIGNGKIQPEAFPLVDVGIYTNANVSIMYSTYLWGR